MLMNRGIAVACVCVMASMCAAQDGTPTPGPPPEAGPEARPPAAATTPIGHVEVRGSGDVPLILIPNLVSDWSVYEAFMGRNSDTYTMYAVTLPGFGGTAAPAEPASGVSFTEGPWLENAERAVLAMIEEKKLEKPLLAGQGLGGHLALRLAQAAPESFRAAVIIHASPAYPLGSAGEPIPAEERKTAVDQFLRAEIEKYSEDQWQEQQRAWIASTVADAGRAKELAGKAAATPKPVSSRYMLEYLGADVTPDLPKLTLPVLVIAGLPDEPGADLTLMREAWPAYYKGAPQVTIVYFEGAFEFITEAAPAELDRAMTQFIRGEPVQGRVVTTRPATPPRSVPRTPSPAHEQPDPAAPETPRK